MAIISGLFDEVFEELLSRLTMQEIHILYILVPCRISPQRLVYSIQIQLFCYADAKFFEFIIELGR